MLQAGIDDDDFEEDEPMMDLEGMKKLNQKVGLDFVFLKYFNLMIAWAALIMKLCLSCPIRVTYLGQSFFNQAWQSSGN